MKNSNSECNLEAILSDIAKRNNLTSILDELAEIQSEETVKVAFLGEFSSGKTSLVNKIVGSKLPVNTKPTTKSICTIRAATDASTENRYFMQNEDGSMREIDWMDFDEKLQVDDEATHLLMEIPNQQWLPDGFELVDTPGEGSLSKESSFTLAYLSQVDAAVFCIPVVDGTVHAHALDFIASPDLRRIHSKMVFALTMADLKSKDDNERIRNEIIRQLSDFAAKGDFDDKELDARTVLVSSLDTDTEYPADGLLKALDKFVFGNKRQLVAERQALRCSQLAKQAVSLLEEHAGSMSLDLSSIREKQELAEKERRKVSKDIDEVRRHLADFKNRLPDNMEAAFDNYAAALVSAKTENEARQIAEQAADAISDAIRRLARNKLGENQFAISQPFGMQLKDRLPFLLHRVDKTLDGISQVALIALSAGVAAAIPGGVAAAGGAVRGMAAAGANAGAKAVAKTTAKVVATTVATATAATATAGQAAVPLPLAKCIQGVSQILDAINPFSYVVDWVAPDLKSNLVNQFKSELLNQSDGIADLIGDEYEYTIVKPLLRQLDERDRLRSQIQEEMESGRRDFLEEKRLIEADIDKLKSLA